MHNDGEMYLNFWWIVYQRACCPHLAQKNLVPECTIICSRNVFCEQAKAMQEVVGHFISTALPDIPISLSDNELCAAAWEKYEEAFAEHGRTNEEFQDVRFDISTLNLVAS